MFFAWIAIGALITTSYGILPGSALADIQRGHRPRDRELAAALVAWFITVIVWPLAIGCRAVSTVRAHRATRQARHAKRRTS